MFNESLRYDYNLPAHPVIFDIGGFKGEWSAGMLHKFYPCDIYCFEPVFKINNPHILVFDFGLGGASRELSIKVDDNKTGQFCRSGQYKTIKIVDVFDFIQSAGIHRIDLMKINIEGMEYELLNRLIETGLIKIIDNLQVQFHNVLPTSDKDMWEVQNRLKETHSPTWQFRYVWENWKRNGEDKK